MNINGLFQFMNTDICDSFFCDVTPDNLSEILEQLMQNPEFLEHTKVFVDDVSILRQKVEIKLGQLCKKKKVVKEEAPVTLPVEKSKIVPDTSGKPEVFETDFEEPVDESLGQRAKCLRTVGTRVETPLGSLSEAHLTQLTQQEASLPNEFGTHIGEGIYLQQEGHVMKMTTPQFVVYY